ncbi:MAG: flagellar motor switch protein FliN [Deltaproteobacteria bacterium]|nr:flagellar motor switch protein FliN [Deltaproteobacteria bacterium]
METGPQVQNDPDFDWEESTHPPASPSVADKGAGDIAAPVAPPPEETAGAFQKLELLLDIPLEITAELGRTRMIINDLLQLGQGSVIELNKLAGEPLEILVNQKLIARGEVVVVNEKFGIRLTDIISPMERIKHLG